MRKTVNINKKIRVVDLFSGAGGLTYGFTHKIYKKNIYRRNIFDIVFANEIDKNAAASFKENFPNIPLFECDIAKIDKIFLLNNNINFNNVDLIIGGPPCQSFSTIGKRKYDERAKLYIEYKRLLSIIRPKIFIFENVIGILSMNDDNNVKVIDNINKLFSGIQSTNGEIGYKLHTKIIDLKKYGVPQTRKRVFIVGVRRDLDIDWQFPSETHGRGDEGKTPYLTLSDVISDLPMIGHGKIVEKYLKSKTEYQKIFRNKCIKITEHCPSKYSEKINIVIKNIREGEGKNNFNSLIEKKQIDEKFFLTSGFANTYARLWWDKPCTTITNNFSSPSSLRCIHPKQNRALTTREGARIQSFPDSFIFIGSRQQKNKQIGNAVPPLFAMKLAEEISKLLLK